MLSAVRTYLLDASPHYPHLDLRTRQYFKYLEPGNSLEYGSEFLVFDFILHPSSEKPFRPPFNLGIFIEVFLMCPSGRKSLGRPPSLVVYFHTSPQSSSRSIPVDHLALKIHPHGNSCFHCQLNPYQILLSSPLLHDTISCSLFRLNISDCFKLHLIGPSCFSLQPTSSAPHTSVPSCRQHPPPACPPSLHPREPIFIFQPAKV